VSIVTEAVRFPSSGTTLPAPLVAIRDVDKQFNNGALALQGLNLTIERGTFVSLLGASGCGKSTLLRLIAGLTTPSRGTIEWAPATTTTHDKVGRPSLSYVFQDATLMPWASALKNVMLPLKIKGERKNQAEEKAREALVSVGLGNFADAYPREMSGGMKMRVSLARALVTQPDLLLLDEPFAALDEITRFNLNNDLAELWRKRRFTVIFVTHSVVESVYLSQRIVVLAARPGRIHADLPVKTAMNRTEEFRSSVEYANLCSLTSENLKGAMRA
jgi:NitT/TauT family transport system ATP-binding protein